MFVKDNLGLMKKVVFYNPLSLSNKECVLSEASLVTLEMQKLEDGRVVFNNIIFRIMRETKKLVVLTA